MGILPDVSSELSRCEDYVVRLCDALRGIESVKKTLTQRVINPDIVEGVQSAPGPHFNFPLSNRLHSVSLSNGALRIEIATEQEPKVVQESYTIFTKKPMPDGTIGLVSTTIGKDDQDNNEEAYIRIEALILSYRLVNYYLRL